MAEKILPSEKIELNLVGDHIDQTHNSVVLANPQHQRAFNNFRLWNSPVLFHVVVLLTISAFNVTFMVNAFRRSVSVLIVFEAIVRVLAIISYALFSLHYFWLEQQVTWSRWVGRLKANVICNIGMLTVMAISMVQIFTIMETAKEDRDIAVTFYFVVIFQSITVRLFFPAADWWAYPLVCFIGCGLSTTTAFLFNFPQQLVYQQVFFFGVNFYSDYDHYKRNLHHFVNYTNLGHATRTAMENEQKQKQAEYASKEMRSFIGNIAHDLKTPLQSFVSELGVLSAPSSQELKLVSVGALESLCSFMLMMINRSLDFVKSESGLTLVPSNATVNLKESLTWVVDCIQRTSHGVPVVCAEVPSLICDFVMTDRQWLEENLLCLASNATKFTTSGSITVRTALTTEEVLPPTTSEPSSEMNSMEDIEAQHERTNSFSLGMLLFEVEDTGIGLSEEQMKSLFRPFKQAQRKAGGTGLGLYALAKRVDAIGGKYGVRGRRDGGKGCLFWFTVPYRPDITAIASAPQNKLITVDHMDDIVFAESNIESHHVKESVCFNILLVDDSPLIQKTTTKILKRTNHVVSSAMNGEQCLDMLEERGDEFDVILMDIQMPVMDGIETIRRIREKEAAASWSDKGSRRQFVIGLSANSDSETRESAIEAGMDDFVPKPLTLALFANAMDGRKLDA